MPQIDTVCAEFPRDLLPLLRCSRDAGPLVVIHEGRSGALGIIDAGLRCSMCSAEYSIEDGIARMLPAALTPEDEHEIAIRNVEYAPAQPGPYVAPASGWRSKFSDLLEIPPHLAPLEPLDGGMVLEVGCGDGRFTILMAHMGARVLAVDFSINALRKIASQLPSGSAPTTYPPPRRRPSADLRAHVGLVQADASHLHVAPRCFDRILSATPLDSRDQRMAMYRSFAEALTDRGRYVGSLENDDLTRRLLGLPTARRYERGGIFIEHFDALKVRREMAPYFHKLHMRPIRPRLPFVQRLPLRCAVAVSRVADRTPVLRDLGEILLFCAEDAIRPPVEGQKRPGSRLVKGFFRWYTRKLGKEPMWLLDEDV